jgi:hypothetical protein
MRGFLTVDEIVRALEAGRVENLVGEAVQAAGMAAGMAVLTEMAQQASRLAAGIVWDRLGPTLPGNLGPAAGAYPTRGTAGPFQIDFARVDLAAANWAARQWRDSWVGVSDETQRAIRAIIARAPVEGITIDQQARLLRQIIGLNARQAAAVVNRYDALIRQWQAGRITAAQVESRITRYEAQLLRQRATMIARTETLNAARASQLLAWQEAQAAGLISQDAMWEWGAAADACDICAELDGTTYMMGDPGPDTHPQCRCWETRYFPGDEVYESHRPTYTGKSVVLKPLGRFPDFASCVSAMSSKLGSVEAARRYCGALQQRIEG